MHSDSHATLMMDYFIPSVQRIGEYDLEYIKIEQVAQGDYDKDNFKDACYMKLLLIKQAIIDNFGDCVLYSDCDLVFIEPTSDFLAELISDNDALFQRDDESICAGFIYFRCNDNMLNFINFCIEHYFEESVHDDQEMMARHIEMIKHELMPDSICNISHFFGAKIWDGEEITIPEGIKVFHANWTIGIDNKIKLLKMI